MLSGNERDLSRAKKVITATMRLKMAKLLFNEPVDPAALGLPNYFDVVKEPMDLGTILGRLSAGEQQEWTECEYQTAEAVYRDVSLVWHNCVLYNSREIDKPTRDAALNVKAIFEQNWKEAGLVSRKPAELPAKTTECLPESHVPQSVGTTQGAMLSLSSLSYLNCGLFGQPFILYRAVSSWLGKAALSQLCCCRGSVYSFACTGQVQDSAGLHRQTC